MLCPKPMFPLQDGGCFASHAIWQGLRMYDVDIDIITACSYKHPFNPKVLPPRMNMEAVYLNLKPSYIAAFFNLFSSSSYILQRFYSKKLEKKIIEKLRQKKYSAIHIESVYMALYIPVIRKYSKAKIFIRPHNQESEIWQRQALGAKNLKKAYFKLLSRRLQREEKYYLSLADMILPISDRDRLSFEKMGLKSKMETLSVGITDTLLPSDIPVEEDSVFYLGAMNWLPNLEGVNWFMKEVWDLVLRDYPNANFYLAGRYMSSRMLNSQHPQTVVMGEIEDAKSFMCSKEVMVVPILSGSGIRIKILEGMLSARPIVTTTIGAEGLDYIDKENILIADTAEDFAKAIVFLLNNKEKAREIGKKGRELVLRNHNIEKITKKLIEYYNS